MKTLENILNALIDLIFISVTPVIMTWLSINTYINWNLDKNSILTKLALASILVLTSFIIYDACLEFQKFKKKIKEENK